MTERSLAPSGLRSKGKALAVSITLAVLTLGLTPEVAAVEQVEQERTYPLCAQALDEPTDGNCRAYEQAVAFSLQSDDEREHIDEPPAEPDGWTWAEDRTLVPESYYEGTDAAPSGS